MSESELEIFLKRWGLHDAIVTKLVWIQETRTLRFEIDDLYSNFDGLPEYPGAAPGAIELREVDQLEIVFDRFDRDGDWSFWIYDFTVEPAEGGKHRASVLFSPGGRILASYRVASISIGKSE
jgi:hypothetical protein